ncbi:MMPL family transporter [Nocardioides iriomotensis]|uniref:MMPL family transporter n=1 Tax=Nocardioides iriomotensis TaxID=715784 RepID=A0A4Q5IUL6_9ACTN|nr:efflux RND transporter permease subunit [Nocardioides iriomotensis]RYU09562.1 MMPL family transporter [Nocardioides iriomotensis]
MPEHARPEHARHEHVRASHRGTRSRRWVLPLLVVLLWLVVGGPMGSFAGRLAEVQENDNAAFLPQSAESTRVLDTFLEFTGVETIPATVVFEREGGLTDDDKAAIEAYAQDLAAVDHVDADGVEQPVYSEDGTAAQVVVPVASSDGEVIQSTIADLREVVADPPDGLTALVGGQAGVLGDFIKAFGAIDGILLVVAGIAVLLILLLVYRSPILPLVVVFCALLSLGVAAGVVYALATNDVLDVNGQSQGILFILAIGAATDYALLIVARFREELRDTESKYDAMGRAYRRSLEPILASGLTVILGLLCLLLSDLSSLRGLGPVGALGVAFAMLSALTAVPAALVLLGRAAYWPFRPAFGSEHPDTRGVWGRVARLVGRRARPVWGLTFVVLAAFAAFLPTINEDPAPQTELFLTEVDSVTAQDVLDRHFTADSANPAIIVTPESKLQDTLAVVGAHEGIAPKGTIYLPDGPPTAEGPPPPKVVDGQAIVLATLADPAESEAGTQTIRDLRTDLDEVGTGVEVGGSTAILIDTRDTTDSDRAKVIPAILGVIFVVLALLLRSLAAPLLLLVANVLSFGATMGVSAILFEHVFDFPSTDPSVMLIGFVFLVALGIDYSIFLMTRVREESVRQGTHPGVLKGLSVTGGVITSAGAVLAATFAALSVIPILFLAQISFIVSFGVLLDTLVVRSLLVPALSYDLGPRVWWPSKLWHTPDHADRQTAAMLHVGEAGGVQVERD